MEESSAARVTILAIAVEDYAYMNPLRGSKKDIENFYELMVINPKTALYRGNQFIKLLNPTSAQIRELVSNYANQRTALGDILIFYFSGHGVAVGHRDFGFCTIDTQFYSIAPIVLPLTVFRFSELLDAISDVDVAPVVIVDACYSGKAGGALISATTAINLMQEKMKMVSASNNALLCSCSDIQTSLNSTKFGGLFSRGIYEIASHGILSDRQAPYLLGLRQIYRPLAEFIERETDDSSPRLYLGETLLEFPLVKNVKYSPQSYVFVGHLKSVIDALWNDGNPIELKAREILKLCGQGSYGNHSKLSLEPWQLVETAPKPVRRRLTPKGLLFAQGKIKIPKSIEKDPTTGDWIPSPETVCVGINDV